MRNLPAPYFSQRETKYKWQRITKDGGEDFSQMSLFQNSVSFGTASNKCGEKRGRTHCGNTGFYRT
jgi:hypothetical protein